MEMDLTSLMYAYDRYDIYRDDLNLVLAEQRTIRFEFNRRTQLNFEPNTYLDAMLPVKLQLFYEIYHRRFLTTSFKISSDTLKACLSDEHIAMCVAASIAAS